MRDEGRGWLGRRPSSLVALVLAAALAAAWPVDSAAQAGDKELKRPKLDAAADTNDWMSYYNYGMRQVRLKPKKAVGAFHWAARLNPARAEPLYGEWAATWMLKPAVLAEYLQGADFIVNSPESRQIDTLLWEAMVRNPIIHRGLEQLLYATANDYTYGKGGWSWSGSAGDQAWLDYSSGRFREAAQEWGALLVKYPKKFHLHEPRAHAFAALAQYDSAVSTMNLLLKEMEKRDRKKLVAFYQSKAMYLYAIGLMQSNAKNYDAAREAYGSALTEDLSMYMAHGRLGNVALAQGDSATAIAEFDLAVQLKGDDPALLNDYGLLLLRVRRDEDAAVVLRKAVQVNPWFASPRYLLALALDRLGKKAEAVSEYREFLARAPLRSASEISLARQRINDLGG